MTHDEWLQELISNTNLRPLESQVPVPEKASLCLDSLGRQVWAIDPHTHPQPPENSSQYSVLEVHGDQHSIVTIPAVRGVRLLDAMNRLYHWTGSGLYEFIEENAISAGSFRMQQGSANPPTPEAAKSDVLLYLHSRVNALLESRSKDFDLGKVWLDPTGGVHYVDVTFSKPVGMDHWHKFMQDQNLPHLVTGIVDSVTGRHDSPTSDLVLSWYRKVADQDRPGTLTKTNPFLAILLPIVVANIFASVIQILYNQSYILPALKPSQQLLFDQMLLPWNIVVFSVATTIVIARHRNVIGILRFAEGPKQPISGKDIFGLINTLQFIVAGGWFCGFLLFTVSLSAFAEPLDGQSIVHFFVSFLIAGVIAWVYSIGFVTLVVLQVLIPVLLPWSQKLVTQDFYLASRRTARRIEWISLGLPLISATFIIIKGPAFVDSGTYDGIASFQILVIAMILGGVTGLIFNTRVAERLKSASLLLRKLASG